MARLDALSEWFRYLTRPAVAALTPAQRAELDPFGTISRVVAQVLDNNLLGRAVDHQADAFVDLGNACIILKGVRSTCRHVPEMVEALGTLEMQCVLLMRDIASEELGDHPPDPAQYIEGCMAAALKVRTILATHSATP